MTSDETAEFEVDEVVEAETPYVPPAIGLVAYCALAAMTRLAKDGDQAPSTKFHVDLATMADEAFTKFKEIDKYGQVTGFSVVEAAGQYAGLFDELDHRTRPSNWWERSVKSYIVIGIFSDVIKELSQRHQIFEDPLLNWDVGHGAWVRKHLAPLTAEDPQLASRLSLWGRRVAGEAFGLVRATLFTYPELAIDPDTVDAVVDYATEEHRKRMEGVNLKP